MAGTVELPSDVELESAPSDDGIAVSHCDSQVELPADLTTNPWEAEMEHVADGVLHVDQQPEHTRGVAIEMPADVEAESESDVVVEEHMVFQNWKAASSQCTHDSQSVRSWKRKRQTQEERGHANEMEPMAVSGGILLRKALNEVAVMHFPSHLLAVDKPDECEQHHFMEWFSCPRMVPVAVSKGLFASVSLDITLGCNLLDSTCQQQAFALLRKHKPCMLMLSPPCTWCPPQGWHVTNIVG